MMEIGLSSNIVSPVVRKSCFRQKHWLKGEEYCKNDCIRRNRIQEGARTVYSTRT